MPTRQPASGHSDETITSHFDSTWQRIQLNGRYFRWANSALILGLFALLFINWAANALAIGILAIVLGPYLWQTVQITFFNKPLFEADDVKTVAGLWAWNPASCTQFLLLALYVVLVGVGIVSFLKFIHVL